MKEARSIGIKTMPNIFIAAILGIILKSEKWFLLIFIFFYALGFMTINLWAAILLFMLSGAVLLAPLTIKYESPDGRKNQLLGAQVLLLLFMPLAAYNIFSRYSDQAEAFAFKTYLIKNECQDFGETISAPGGCDELDCLDYEVTEYTCQGNKKINSYDFKIGREAGLYRE